MIVELALAAAIAASSGQAGRATSFDHPSVDPWNTASASGEHLACRAHARPSKLAARLIAAGSFVAHKRIPCYELLLVCSPRTGRCARAIVADWGPVHAFVDLYAPLSRALKHSGDEPAIVFRMGSAADPRLNS